MKLILILAAVFLNVLVNCGDLEIHHNIRPLRPRFVSNCQYPLTIKIDECVPVVSTGYFAIAACQCEDNGDKNVHFDLYDDDETCSGQSEANANVPANGACTHVFANANVPKLSPYQITITDIAWTLACDPCP
eukprot:281538_1